MRCRTSLLKDLVRRLTAPLVTAGCVPLVLFVLASPPTAPGPAATEQIAAFHGDGATERDRAAPSASGALDAILPLPRAGARPLSPEESDDRRGHAGDGPERVRLERVASRGGFALPLPTLPVGFIPDKALAPPTSA